MQLLALLLLVQTVFSQTYNIFDDCPCQNGQFVTQGRDANGYLLDTLPPSYLGNDTAYGVLTSGDRSDFFSSTTEQLYQTSKCFPTAGTCPSDPTKNFVFDYQLSTGAFASGDGAFDVNGSQFGGVEVWDPVNKVLITDSSDTTSAACTEDECTFRKITSEVEITRKVYVHTADQQNPFSWARVIDSFRNVDTRRYLQFKYTLNFGCLRTVSDKKRDNEQAGFCFAVDCANLGGIEAAATATYLTSPASACARTVVRGDTKSISPVVGVVFQGAPPESSQDLQWRAFAVDPTGDGSVTLTTPPELMTVGQEDSYMWFIIQTNPNDVAGNGDIINQILTSPREFDDDLEADQPFYGISEEEWFQIVNWESGATSLVPLFLLSFASVFLL